MPVSPNDLSINELTDDIKAALSALKASPDPLQIREGSDVVAIMMLPEQYARLQHDLELLKCLLSGELEINNGDWSDLDSVMAAADELLAGRPGSSETRRSRG